MSRCRALTALAMRSAVAAMLVTSGFMGLGDLLTQVAAEVIGLATLSVLNTVPVLFRRYRRRVDCPPPHPRERTAATGE